MNQLPSNIKLNVLRGLGQKMRNPTSSPMQLAQNLPQPKLDNPLTSRVQKEVNPDYFPKRKTTLTGKLF